MIRPAKPDDIPAIVELAVEALSINPYPELVINREKVFAIVRECVSSAAHFAWVSERDGAITGGVGALAHDSPFYDRRQVDVLMCYCREPGEGIKLLRELRRWYLSRPIHKMMTFTLDRSMDKRMLKLLPRLKFTEAVPTFIQVR